MCYTGYSEVMVINEKFNVSVYKETEGKLRCVFFLHVFVKDTDVKNSCTSLLGISFVSFMIWLQVVGALRVNKYSKWKEMRVKN